jgi:hypothetical protein
VLKLIWVAQNQRDPNPAHGLFEQGYASILQGIMGSHAERTRQPSRCTERIAGGKEARTAEGTGESAPISVTNRD